MWPKRKPNLQIMTRTDAGEVPALLRWYILPPNKWLSIYVHRTVQDNDKRALRKSSEARTDINRISSSKKPTAATVTGQA